MLTLYYAPRTISVVAAIALHEAGLDHRLIRVDFETAEQTKPDYLRINPKGRVPTLVTDRGTLTETGALLDYIAALAPDAGLIPDDRFDAARMREVMYYLASTMHVNHAHRMRGYRWADQETSHADMAARVPRTMTESCAYIEAHGLSGPFVLGQQVSLADFYLYVITTWLDGDGVDTTRFPKLTAFMACMAARASVRDAVAQSML